MSAELQEQLWPTVKKEEIDPDWWNRVMYTTSFFNDLFDPNLSDEEDFVIRSMAYVIVSGNDEAIKWYFEDSIHQDRARQIQDLLRNENASERERGAIELQNFIADYNSDVVSSFTAGDMVEQR
jgi:hypothetical protein